MMKLSLSGQRNPFKLPNAALSITPDPLKNISMTIPMISKGGKVIGIKNEHFLRTNLRSFLRAEQYESYIAKYLKADNSSLLQPWFRKASNFFDNIKRANGLLNQGNISGSEKYFELVKRTKLVKNAQINLKAFVDVLISSLANKINHVDTVKEARRFSLLLARTERLIVEPMLELTQMYDDNGMELKFTGQLCIYQLCFPTIDDVKIDVSPDKETIEIRGNLKAFKASNRLHFSDKDELQITVSKYSNMFVGKVTGYFILFGKKFPLKISFDQSSLSYQSFISIDQMFEDFEISHTGEIILIGWKDLVKSISGELSGTKYLQNLIENEAAEISNHTTSRLNRALIRKEQALKEYQDMLNLYQSAKDEAEKASGEYESVNSKYKENLVELKTEQKRYSSTLQQDASLILIERDVSKLCDLVKCNETCIPIVACDVCQQQLQIPSKQWKCTSFVEDVKTSKLVEVTETCEKTNYTFRTIYTGILIILTRLNLKTNNI